MYFYTTLFYNLPGVLIDSSSGGSAINRRMSSESIFHIICLNKTVRFPHTHLSSQYLKISIHIQCLGGTGGYFSVHLVKCRTHVSSGGESSQILYWNEIKTLWLLLRSLKVKLSLCSLTFQMNISAALMCMLHVTAVNDNGWAYLNTAMLHILYKIVICVWRHYCIRTMYFY